MIELKPPSLPLLPEYIAALRTGWSPDNTRDVTVEHLDSIETDPAAFIAGYQWTPGQVVRISDGTTRPRLPGSLLWIWDGQFCGAINYRYVPGTVELPSHVLGHVGYAVVPAKRGQGIARAAVRLLLPILHGLGMPRISISAHKDNMASQRVILAAGGIPAETVPPEWPASERLFWVQTAK